MKGITGKDKELGKWIDWFSWKGNGVLDSLCVLTEFSISNCSNVLCFFLVNPCKNRFDNTLKCPITLDVFFNSTLQLPTIFVTTALF